jgi:hypothetical protein
MMNLIPGACSELSSQWPQPVDSKDEWSSPAVDGSVLATHMLAKRKAYTHIQDIELTYTKRQYTHRTKSKSVLSLSGKHMTIESILEITRNLRITRRGKHVSRVRSEFTGSGVSASKTNDFVVTNTVQMVAL